MLIKLVSYIKTQLTAVINPTESFFYASYASTWTMYGAKTFTKYMKLS